MVNECTPYYEPGGRISCRPTADITGKRFVKVSANVESGPGLSDDELLGLIKVAPCGAGDLAFGVAGYDVTDASNYSVPVICMPGIIIPVTAGEDLTADTVVQSDATGKAVSCGDYATLATGTAAVNRVTFTSRKRGADGNDLTITFVDPGGTTASLSIDVDGNDIIVNLARAASAISSVPADIVAAILEHDAASQLVTGVASGSSVVAAVAKTNLAGGTGSPDSSPAGLCLTAATSGGDAMIKLF